MLVHFQILNFIIIKKLDLDFQNNLTVITGETGAGKSIIIDALSMLLGSRGDSSLVGPYQDKSHLTATFNIEHVALAKAWLSEQEYIDADSNECIISRVLHKDGKTRQMINGFACTLQQLKEFIPLLIDIHSQNQQQNLIKRSYQRDLVDIFGNHLLLCEQVKTCYEQWLANEQQLAALKKIQNNATIERDLVDYQIQEFEKINLLPNEYSALDQEHKQLANAETLIKNCQEAMTLLDSEKGSAQNTMYQANNLLRGIQHYDKKIFTASELLNQALIYLEEARTELQSFMNQVEINPERLHEVEKRLSKIVDIARKYQVAPENLLETYTQLLQKQQEINCSGELVEKLITKSAQLKKNYFEAADQLHQLRLKIAAELSENITKKIQSLGMAGGIFKIAVNKVEEMSPNGSEIIEFLVATNPGQSLQPLSKVASGGEISRIALAIYVATAQKNTTPILVFDEVDVGIGGSTATVVGQLLKSLGENAQIFCITHLPQVAAYGDQHFCVRKKFENNLTTTEIIELSEEEKITEVARMLGGITITEKTLAHARELIIAQ